eukprot:scaffold287_cov337-Pavlova_lutheri.AAC.131
MEYLMADIARTVSSPTLRDTMVFDSRLGFYLPLSCVWMHGRRIRGSGFDLSCARSSSSSSATEAVAGPNSRVLSSAAHGTEGAPRPNGVRKHPITCGRRGGGTAGYGEGAEKILRVPSRTRRHAWGPVRSSSAGSVTVPVDVPGFRPGFDRGIPNGGSFGIRPGIRVTHPFPFPSTVRLPPFSLGDRDRPDREGNRAFHPLSLPTAPRSDVAGSSWTWETEGCQRSRTDVLTRTEGRWIRFKPSNPPTGRSDLSQDDCPEGNPAPTRPHSRPTLGCGP